jgi:hypothetical protein
MAKTTVPAPPDVDTLDQPDRATEQVPGGFAKELDSSTQGNDVEFVQPLNEQKVVAPAESNQTSEDLLSTLFQSPSFVALVEREVAKRVADGQPHAGPQRFIDASAQSHASVKPDFDFLKHYRNDASPELWIQELDMDAIDPRLAPLPGRGMQFRRSHFFATTENQVKQIEWMSSQATHSADGTRVTGGVVGIYEDDGEELFYCPAGCPVDQFAPTANKKKFDAHMRAVHGVEV